MKCEKCKVKLKKGIALENTWTGFPDFYGGAVCTLHPGGPGKLIPCLKCPQCGKSYYF